MTRSNTPFKDSAGHRQALKTDIFIQSLHTGRKQMSKKSLLSVQTLTEELLKLLSVSLLIATGWADNERKADNTQPHM